MIISHGTIFPEMIAHPKANDDDYATKQHRTLYVVPLAAVLKN